MQNQILTQKVTMEKNRYRRNTQRQAGSKEEQWKSSKFEFSVIGKVEE